MCRHQISMGEKLFNHGRLISIAVPYYCNLKIETNRPNPGHRRICLVYLDYYNYQCYYCMLSTEANCNQAISLH